MSSTTATVEKNDQVGQVGQVGQIGHVAVNRKQVLSLFGLVPLSAYVLLHLWTNMSSLGGPEAFDKALRDSRNHPGFLYLEIFGLGVPLVAHMILGLMELARWRPNNLQYTFFQNLKFLLQRVSAVGLMLFIGAHVVKARILPAMDCGGAEYCAETWRGMHEALSEPVTLTVYVLGLLGVSYHLADGLYTAAMRWGLVISNAGRRRMQGVSIFFLLLLLGMSFSAIWGFQPFDT